MSAVRNLLAEYVQDESVEIGPSPSPWVVACIGCDDEGRLQLAIADSAGRTVAEVCKHNRAPKRADANAQLLALAPQMRDAIARAVAWMESVPLRSWEQAETLTTCVKLLQSLPVVLKVPKHGGHDYAISWH